MRRQYVHEVDDPCEVARGTLSALLDALKQPDDGHYSHEEMAALSVIARACQKALKHV